MHTSHCTERLSASCLRMIERAVSRTILVFQVAPCEGNDTVALLELHGVRAGSFDQNSCLKLLYRCNVRALRAAVRLPQNTTTAASVAASIHQQPIMDAKALYICTWCFRAHALPWSLHQPPPQRLPHRRRWSWETSPACNCKRPSGPNSPRDSRCKSTKAGRVVPGPTS